MNKEYDAADSMEVGRKQKQKPYTKSKVQPLRSGQEDVKVTFCSLLISPCIA